MSQFKAEPISTVLAGFTTDLSQVERAAHLDGVLNSSSISANMCSCCGRIFIGGHDRAGALFVALPVDAAVAIAIAENLIEFARESEALGGGRNHKH